MPKLTLPTVSGKPVRVGWCDPLWCRIERRRVRFLGVTADGMLLVGEEDGKPLPDLRHRDQVWAVG